MDEHENENDQAAGLRAMASAAPVNVIAVSSGKGGVGKTTMSVNLSATLAMRGRRVLLMDADLGLANVDVMLGLRVKSNLSHVLAGECELEDIVLEGPGGLRIVPASSGRQEMAQLSTVEHAALIRSFASLREMPEFLLVDTAAGISNSVVQFAQASQQIIVVVCNEPASITDAYALIKVLSRDHGVNGFHVLASMVHSPEEGRQLYRKIANVSERFLGTSLSYLGMVPHDDKLRRAIQRQGAVSELYPRSRAAAAFRELAARIEKWPHAGTPSGNIEFFFERMVALQQRQAVA